ncbi:DUF2267 domain-containing protein [Streptomyces sp. NPDC054995]
MAADGFATRSICRRYDETGGYDTAQEAEHAAHVGAGPALAHLLGEVRAQLAARPPKTFTLILLEPAAELRSAFPERLVRATFAWKEGATEQTATRDVSAALSSADTADEDLTGPILLPSGRPQTIWPKPEVPCPALP